MPPPKAGAGGKCRAHLCFSRRTGDPADTELSGGSARMPRGQRSAVGPSGQTTPPQCDPAAADLRSQTSGTEATGGVRHEPLTPSAAARTFRGRPSSAQSSSVEPRSSTSRHLARGPSWKRTRVPGRRGAVLRTSSLWAPLGGGGGEHTVRWPTFEEAVPGRGRPGDVPPYVFIVRQRGPGGHGRATLAALLPGNEAL